jgi:hypothetical protein
MARGFSVVAALLLCSITVTGCRLYGGANGRSFIEVTLVDARTLEVEGRILPLKQAAKALRSAGASPETDIQVAIGKQTDPRVMASVTRALAPYGFRRIVFTRPQQATATAQQGRK